jgi:hypothetical protein
MVAVARKRAERFSDQRFHEDFNQAIGYILSAREADKLQFPSNNLNSLTSLMGVGMWDNVWT